MRFSVNLPNFGDFADPHAVAAVAVAAEEAGWDALFVWDHIVFDKARPRPLGDPWILLAAAALATTRIRLGTLVTPVARRRPHQLARQVSTVDHLSAGRVIFGAGLGAPIETEFGSFGEPTEPRVLAEMLDEGLDLLARYWSGEQISHQGRHFQADGVTLLPTPAQPRVPVWVAGYWPHRRPMRRAARWDGAVPLFAEARHGHAPAAEVVREVTDYLRAERADRAEGPFEVVVGGASPADPTRARDLIGPLADAGATWWDERRTMDDDIDRLDAVRRRVEAGPPKL